jgi:replication factor C subunit 3/5
MTFLIDKYAPKKIEEIDFHKELIQKLIVMAQDESIPHLIFHGPQGSGKNTIIQLLLVKLYDEGVLKTEDSKYIVIGSGNKTNEVFVKQSNYHIVIEPNNTNFDRYLIHDIVKEYAKKLPLNVFQTSRIFKTVLINNLDNLPYHAQTSLRRTMEKYSGNCRFIMWCKSLSSVIEPLRSRCVCLRVSSPTNTELFPVMYKIAVKEDVHLKFTDYMRILDEGNGNIKKILWLIELHKHGDDELIIYDEILNQIVILIINCSLQNTQQIKDLLYNVMITNINGTTIIKDITLKLCESQLTQESVKYEIIEEAAKFEHNLIRGRREIIHLEAFIMSVLNILYVANNNKLLADKKRLTDKSKVTDNVKKSSSGSNKSNKSKK